MTVQAAPTRRMTHMEAVIEAIAQEMRLDERVFVIGQDIGLFQGAMQSAQGLFSEFGPKRVREAPISESAMVGAALGAALFGMRPIVDISFGEFLPAAMNQIVNQAPNLHYMTGGAAKVPVVIRTRMGDGPYGGHPQDYSNWFTHVPGLKVLMPASPVDAKGLMSAAIRDDNPVLFIEPMSVSHAGREEVRVERYALDIGKARVARAGSHITVVAWGSTVPTTIRASLQLDADGVDLEIMDLRSLQPWDVSAVLASVRKTGCLITVEESWVTSGFGAEVVATVAERALDDLMAPVIRIGAAAVPIPTGPLRKYAIPNESSVIDAVRAMMTAVGR